MTPSVFICSERDVRDDVAYPPSIDEVIQNAATNVAQDAAVPPDLRGLILGSYEVPRIFYKVLGAGKKLSSYGALFNYWNSHSHTGRRKRPPMDIQAMVTMWKPVIVGLATAHDKDEADRYERELDKCLTPILTAPVRDLRTFAGELLKALKEDKSVPFLVWRAYEVWVEEFVTKAADSEVLTLKTAIAQEIAQLVEKDLQPQLSTALVHALQWRSPEALEQVKVVVEREKAQGRAPRLRGRESCLFMECGGTEEKPEVVIQI